MTSKALDIFFQSRGGRLNNFPFERGGFDSWVQYFSILVSVLDLPLHSPHKKFARPPHKMFSAPSAQKAGNPIFRVLLRFYAIVVIL